MFRKPKKNLQKKAFRRKREEDDDNGDGDKETSRELAEARKRAKLGHKEESQQTGTSTSSTLMQQFEASKTGPISQKDLATSTNEHHPTKVIDRGNKFLAGPIKAPTNIRTTCRFDYQPDICKDYKETGFCGFGDTCIYLHDRGDTLSGWQLEQKWQEEQELKKKKQKEEMDAFLNGTSGKEEESKEQIADDGLPFACHICRSSFDNPVVTSCNHFFCERCIVQQVKEGSSLCPICNKDTFGVFNQPTKLLSKKRRLCGRDSTWEDFQKACQKASSEEETDEQ